MTKALKRTAVEVLCEGIGSFFDVQEWMPIQEFCENVVDLSDDVSAPRSSVDFENYPYMVDIINSCMIEEGVRKEVVFVAPEQCGKTMIQNLAILWNCVYNTMQCLVIYPSADLSAETSQTKFIPLFKKIPQFSQDIEQPRAIRNDRLVLSNAKIYWQGAGTKIISKSAKMVCCDEVATWQPPPNVDAIEDCKKRTRSYNECLVLLVSTPTVVESRFWDEFLSGSQGYWHLRCQHCGELSMRACDTVNLQFESQYDESLRLYVPVMGSCRMVCPKCGFEHTEDMKEKMIKQGAYVHRFPDRLHTRPSFQVSVLASMLTAHNWDSIAEQQLKSGRTSDLSQYISFQNSIRGLPFSQADMPRAQGDAALEKIMYKPDDLKAEDVECVFIACDTQDTCSVMGRFALTRNNEIFMLDIHRPRFMYLEEDERKLVDMQNRREGKAPEKTVLDFLNEDILGMHPLMCLVDRQGHRTQEVDAFARQARNIVKYAGTSLKYEVFKESESIPKLWLFNEKTYRSELIYRLYYDKSHSYRLPKELAQQDCDEITVVQPDKEHRNGSLWENWVPVSDGVHDVFDVAKMAICATKLAPKIFRPDKFKHNEAKCLNLDKDKEQKPHKPRPQAPRHSLFHR